MAGVFYEKRKKKMNKNRYILKRILTRLICLSEYNAVHYRPDRINNSTPDERNYKLFVLEEKKPQKCKGR